MKKLSLLTALLLLALSLPAGAKTDKNLLNYVDPLIGTGAHNGDYSHGNDAKGQCMPGVLEPNGMNSWTPQTEKSEGHGVCPYYANRTKLQGFRNSHYLNGSNTQDFGSVTIMPLLGELRCQPEERASTFSHSEETAQPDYYAVSLFEGTIKAEMTGTSRTAIFRFTFSKSGMAHLVVTPNSDYGDAAIHIDPGKGEVTGYNAVHRFYQGYGQRAGFSGHFLIQVRKTVTGYGTYEGQHVNPQAVALSNHKAMGAYLSFPVKAGEVVLVKVSSSFCNLDGARNNMKQENAGWNFDKVRRRLTRIWQQRLKAIEVETDDEASLTKFYTALYHASFLPNAFSDADGRYPSFSGGTKMIHIQGTYYDNYSLWDTFRALHPLLSILYPQQSGEMLQSLLLKYDQGGWLPIFPAWNSYTSEMIGDPCASLFADAYTKGIRNFDAEKACQALVKNAFEQPSNPKDYEDGKGRRALTTYMKYGYIPLEDKVPHAYHQREQVSRTLEYAYDDYCVARLAEALGHHDMARKLYKRSENFRNVFDPRIGYVMGRYADGRFIDGKRPDRGQSFITEGNPCQYSWYVPHDVYGLMECMGGKEQYLLKLDSMFTEHRMWHGNEPSHQISFMYNYAGKPWKTAERVRQLMATEYGLGANGLSGNDDAGQMSAWYIFASLGFYPVCPGSGYYVLASPSFRKAVIHMSSGKRFVIEAENVSGQNIYIQQATLNGKPYDMNYLRHSDIASGGTLHFVMGPSPNLSWGTSATSLPPSTIPEN